MFRGLARKLSPHKFAQLSRCPRYDCERHIGKGEKKDVSTVNCLSQGSLC